MITNEEVINDTKILAVKILNLDEVKLYIQLETALNNNEKFKTLQNQKFIFQRQLTRCEYVKKTSKCDEAKKRLEDTEKKMDEMPIFSEFIKVKNDVNYLVQLISSTISETIEKELNILK